MRGAAATSTVPPPCEKPISAIRPASMPGWAARVRSAANASSTRSSEVTPPVSQTERTPRAPKESSTRAA